MKNDMKSKIIKWLDINSSQFGEFNYFVDEPMSNHTTFKIGGNVDILIIPRNREQLEQIYKLQNKFKFPLYTIGQGSNILIHDEGIDGVVVKLEYSSITVCENIIEAAAGVSLIKLAQEAMRLGLTGLEFASGIPGTIGGAVFMNAGAYGGNISDVVKEITVFTKNGHLKKLTNNQLSFGYRQCLVQNTGDFILDVTIELKKGDNAKIEEVMNDLFYKRNSKQPLDMPSAGSVFKRPEGYYAGQLIDEAGLRGLSCGDAQVSQKHCGFIVNKGAATAGDVMELVGVIQKVVYDKFGVKLERELRILGQ